MEEYKQTHRFLENQDVAEEARRVLANIETLFPTRIMSGRTIDEVVDREGRQVHCIGSKLVDKTYVIIEYDEARKGELVVKTKGPLPSWVDRVLSVRSGSLSTMRDKRYFSQCFSYPRSNQAEWDDPEIWHDSEL